jgi:hypothetical protein
MVDYLIAAESLVDVVETPDDSLHAGAFLGARFSLIDKGFVPVGVCCTHSATD